MAESSLSAKRFAQAVFELAREKQELEQWQSDLFQLSAAARNPELSEIMQNPRFDLGRKMQVLKLHLPDVRPVALNLANILTDRGNFSLVLQILEVYTQLLDDYTGKENAEVTSAVPLDDGEKLKISTNLSNITGKKVSLIEKVDPAILGGLIIRTGGKMIDGSTRSRLAALKTDLAGDNS